MAAPSARGGDGPGVRLAPGNALMTRPVTRPMTRAVTRVLNNPARSPCGQGRRARRRERRRRRRRRPPFHKRRGPRLRFRQAMRGCGQARPTGPAARNGYTTSCAGRNPGARAAPGNAAANDMDDARNGPWAVNAGNPRGGGKRGSARRRRSAVSQNRPLVRCLP